ncbi:MAG: NUDIX domain-containing protein [Clostridiales bacterium]|nr:NUDIX domain-containing protein [Clostridiales bacterium]
MVPSLRNMTSVYLIRNENMLLLYRQGSRVANDVYIGAAGGHFEPHELNDPKACALREMKEEIDITADMVEDLSLRYIALRNVNGEVRQNYYFFANLKEERMLSSNEGILKWVPLEEVMLLPMPFTSKFVLAHYLESGRFNDTLYGGVATVEEIVFFPMG